jgi:hypothetical protein
LTRLNPTWRTAGRPLALNDTSVTTATTSAVPGVLTTQQCRCVCRGVPGGESPISPSPGPSQSRQEGRGARRTRVNRCGQVRVRRGEPAPVPGHGADTRVSDGPGHTPIASFLRCVSASVLRTGSRRPVPGRATARRLTGRPEDARGAAARTAQQHRRVDVILSDRQELATEDDGYPKGSGIDREPHEGRQRADGVRQLSGTPARRAEPAVLVLCQSAQASTEASVVPATILADSQLPTSTSYLTGHVVRLFGTRKR